MKLNGLTYKNITFFTRYYKLVAVAVLITIAVLVGSLVIGDSVRTTLVKRVTERLGDTETIIFSRNSFMEEQLLESPLFKDGARGILLMNGFISHSGKLTPVFVWGVDDMSVSKGSAKINTALLNEMDTKNPDAIVLRLPASGLVPSGSLFVTENYTTSMRLSFDGVVDMDNGGNISMKNEQAIPLNIFVNRDELAEVMKTEGKVNLILVNKDVSAEEMEKTWDYSLSGLSVNPKDGFMEITSDRVFLQEDVVATISENNQKPNRIFSYLANSIERKPQSKDGQYTGKNIFSNQDKPNNSSPANIVESEASIPYSFVTAMDSYKGEVLHKNEIILSDYSANRLSVKAGDSILVTYFTSKDLKTLHTDTVLLTVKKIIPLTELSEDKTLSADFPGLSDVERCTDWDSDLPINMDLITDEDERYWEHYKSTPKAIIAYEAVANDWSNSYGNATAIRIESADTHKYAAPDLSKLRFGMFGIQLIHPRGTGLYAAMNGVDFSGLFLALGFFIIISSILLMIVPLSEMLYRRKDEIALLKALGYTKKRITKMLWRESAPVVLISSTIGVIVGILYTILIMWLLGNVWKGATHTEGFAAYPDIITVIAGLSAGIILSLFILWRVIAKNLREKHLNNKKSKISLKGKKMIVIFSSILTITIICFNFLFLHSVTLFVVVGIILFGTAAIWGDYLICRNGVIFTEYINSKKLKGSNVNTKNIRNTHGTFNTKKLIWSTLYANRKQAILSFLTLATGVFIVFSVGLNRKSFADSSTIQAGTGGFSLWCESSVPIYHNMATQAGREKLSLTTLPANTKIQQCLRYSADDASCLNLNKVISPTVLGVDMNSLIESDFHIEQNIYSTEGKDAFKHMQICADSVYPALVDATVLTWSLSMALGDTLYYENNRGQRIAILLAGTLPNTIFQGNILIDRQFFSDIWEEITGSEIFLIKTEESQKEEVKTLLSQALNEYGVRVTTTNDRLKQFNTVTDTYLTIFMTLGGLGLLLGIMSFIIVVRKNLSARRKEINLYRTLGFTDYKIEQTLYRENLIVPLYAIATGVISSLAGVSLNFMNTGIWIWFMAFLFTIFFVVCVVLFVKKSVKLEINETNNHC